MSDLISRAALFNALASCQEKGDIFAAIQDAPAVDAVSVVRCKDCRHSRPDALLDYAVKCTVLEHIMQSNDFCSYGEVEDA